MALETLLAGPRAPGMAGLYLPPDVEVPAGDPCALVFDLPGLAGYAVGEASLIIQRATVLTHAVAYTERAAGFRVQIYHTHGQAQHQLFQKALPWNLVLGTARLPMLFKSPYYVEAGDSLSVEVRNLDNTVGATNTIQIALWGVQL